MIRFYNPEGVPPLQFVTHSCLNVRPSGYSCRIGQYSEGERPLDAAELASRLLTSVYMGTEVRPQLPLCAPDAPGHRSVCLTEASRCDPGRV